MNYITKINHCNILTTNNLPFKKIYNKNKQTKHEIFLGKQRKHCVAQQAIKN
jgi:hypothetical protein